MTDFGVGLVGAGTISANHVRALEDIPDARLVAVAEPREEAGRALAATQGAAWYPDLESMLERPDLHVVILGTPSGMHPEQANLAARAGRHVITEKPMAITLEGADRMIASAREAGVTLSVIFQNRFHRDALRLKRAVEAGLFGRLVFANAFVHWRRAPEYYSAGGGWRGTYALDGGGALMNQSIHTVDLLRWIAGPVETVSAHTGTLVHAIEAEDAASATLRFASGALGCIQGSTSASASHPATVQIVGTDGAATLQGSRLALWEPARDEEVLSGDDLGSSHEPEEGERWVDSHRTQMRLIFDALRAGAVPPVPGEEARHAMELVLAIYAAARTGERVELFPSDPTAKEKRPGEETQRL
jgi:predicted dehydrogenase